MLKEINGQCSREDTEIFEGIEMRYPVSIDVKPGGSESRTLFTITEIEEGAVGASFYKDMKTLMDYLGLFRQLELEQTESPNALASLQLNVEKIATISTEEVPYYLALWRRLATQMREAFEA